MQQISTLVIFSPAFPEDEADTGWLPWLQTFVLALNKNYPSLHVIIFSFQYPHHSTAYTWHNNTVIPFNGMRRKKLRHAIMWIDVIRKFAVIRKQYHVTGILSLWCSECTLIAKYCASFFNTRYYCWILGQDARPFNKYVQWIRPKPQQLIAMSDFLVTQFQQSHGIQPAHVIVNGVATDLYVPMPVHRDIDILGVGSFITLKQYDQFLEIVAALKKDFPFIKAVLCGDGEQRKHIEALIEELGLQQNVVIKGFLFHSETLQIMQHAKILLHPSSYEGFSTACLEALYAGARVISYVQPMQQQITNWYIVPSKEAMLATALALLQNHSMVYERVLVNSIDDSATQMMQLFTYHE